MKRISKLIYKDYDFYKIVLAMMIPIACQNMITIAVNITDTMMLGMLGESQLSASSLAGQYINMFQTFCMGTSMGASVLAARYWGMKEMKSLHITITIMLRIVMGLAFIFAVIAWIAPDWIMQMYTNDEVLIQQGIQYLGFAVPAFFFHGLSQGSTIIMRSMQKVKIPLYTSIGAFILNIIGNYIFIFGKFGVPGLGIAGASLSTLIVRIFECVINFGYLVFLEKDAAYRVRNLFMRTRELLPEYMRISIPVLISDGMMAFGSNAVMMIVGRLGSGFVASNAIAAVVERLCTAFSGGISQASAMITGKTLGESKTKEVQEQGYAFLGLGLLVGIVGAGLILVICNPVTVLYHLTSETAVITKQLLFASAIIVIFQSTSNILTKGVLRGGGDTKVLMIADSIFLWVVSIPLGYFVGITMGFAPFWIYMALKMDNFCKMIWSVYRLNGGKWIKKIKSVG